MLKQIFDLHGPDLRNSVAWSADRASLFAPAGMVHDGSYSNDLRGLPGRTDRPLPQRRYLAKYDDSGQSQQRPNADRTGETPLRGRIGINLEACEVVADRPDAGELVRQWHQRPAPADDPPRHLAALQNALIDGLSRPQGRQHPGIEAVSSGG